MRFRNVYMGIFSILILMALFVTSPDNDLIQQLPYGAGFIATIMVMLMSVLYIAIMHFSRKGLFDYINLAQCYLKAMETPEGAASIFRSVVLAMFPIAFLIWVAVK